MTALKRLPLPAAALAALVVLALLPLAGCLDFDDPAVFLHPGFTKQAMARDVDLAGAWPVSGHKDADFVVLSKKKKKGWYKLDVVRSRDLSRNATAEDEDEPRYKAGLFRCGDRLFLDVTVNPDAWSRDGLDLDNILRVQAHTFWLVERAGGGWWFKPMDMDWLGRYLEDHPGTLPVEMTGWWRVVTANTTRIRHFLQLAADMDGAFLDDFYGGLPRKK